jgi:hypothetical protein
MEAMKAELDALKRHVFGSRSKKMPTPEVELRRKGKVKRDPATEKQRRKDNKKTKAALETEDAEHTIDVNDEADCPQCGKCQGSGNGIRFQLGAM